MKKILSTLALGVSALSLAACGATDTAGTMPSNPGPSTSTFVLPMGYTSQSTPAFSQLCADLPQADAGEVRLFDLKTDKVDTNTSQYNGTYACAKITKDSLVETDGKIKAPLDFPDIAFASDNHAEPFAIVPLTLGGPNDLENSTIGLAGIGPEGEQLKTGEQKAAEKIVEPIVSYLEAHPDGIVYLGIETERGENTVAPDIDKKFPVTNSVSFAYLSEDGQLSTSGGFSTHSNYTQEESATAALLPDGSYSDQCRQDYTACP